jgi:hypothetical protein
MTAPHGLRPGFYIVGEYLGVDAPREFTGRDGQPAKSRPAVRLLVDRHVQAIPFEDEESIEQALGNAELRDVVAVPVYAQGRWDETRNRRSPADVSWKGRVIVQSGGVEDDGA